MSVPKMAAHMFIFYMGDESEGTEMDYRPRPI